MSPKSSDTGVEDDSTDIDKKKKKRHKRKEKKHKKKKRKHASSDSESESCRKSKSKKRKRSKDKNKDKIKVAKLEDDDVMPGPSVPVDFIPEAVKARAPMTKEQWEKSQSIVRRVYDEETGRTRLVKGDGEILEEIVSKDRHREINRQATIGDGLYFQSKLQKR